MGIRKQLNLVNYLIVMDCETNDIHFYKIAETQEEDLEEFMDSKGHNSGNCNWMVVDKVIIKKHYR